MFEPKRDFANKKLIDFVDNNLFEYSKLRNFDFGPDKRTNISCLSPYITHGILTELEVMKLSLKKHSFVKIEKFIQEVLWRVYWKGWLELRPNVWTDYIIELNKLKQEFKDNKDYLNAIEGKTNIECFNTWVNELKNHNYLHNHTRMWFASIWIFTLKLPWQLGAEFFMKYLFDGDSASNTLGWRWVAGVQTKGKNYVASEWNIKKFTNNKFNNIKLNEGGLAKISQKNYTPVKKEFSNPNNLEYKDLAIFENILPNENYSLSISRSFFDELCSSFFQEAMKPVLSVLEDNSLSKSNIDDVVLVGGTTKIPYIQNMLQAARSTKAFLVLLALALSYVDSNTWPSTDFKEVNCFECAE